MTREEAIKGFEDMKKGLYPFYPDEYFDMAIKALEQEPKTGHWIETHDDWGNGIITDRKYKCSVCHGKHIDPEMGEWHEVFDYKYPFCPNCGVKMAESEENEE